MEYENGFFYSASQFYKETFGMKMYKLSLDAGTTCPNRDGTKAYGGCIFCSERGSGDFAPSGTLSISEQVVRAKSLVSQKVKGGAYLAYFQNFTGTYGDPAVLKQKYLEALSDSSVKGLCIATRPDCLSSQIIDILKEISSKHFLQIELGLQTSNEKTGEYIRRFYSNEDYASAVRLLKEQVPKAHVVTHLIYGLPFDTKDDMLSSLDFSVSSGTDGIKISCLHILKGTKLLDDFQKGLFSSLEMDEYFSLISESLLRLPPNIVVHRLTGDGAKKILVAPEWTMDKKRVMNSMRSYFSKNQIVQGKFFQYN